MKGRGKTTERGNEKEKKKKNRSSKEKRVNPPRSSDNHSEEALPATT